MLIENFELFYNLMSKKTVFQLYIEIQFCYNVLDHKMLKNTQCKARHRRSEQVDSEVELVSFCFGI